MDANNKPRNSRSEKIFNDILVAANGCLAVAAILLACMIFIELQLASWQARDDGTTTGGAAVGSTVAPSTFQMTMQPS